MVFRWECCCFAVEKMVMNNLNYMSMNIKNAFNQFCNDLQKCKGIMTEDNIRYYWFVSMLRQDNLLDNYTLEQPYSEKPIQSTALPDEELDLLYMDSSSNECFCFEIKFNRKSAKSSPAKTSQAGEVINDLQRLQQIPTSINGRKAHRLMLYVTDDIMHNYYTSMRQPNKVFGQQLNDFYNAKINAPLCLNFSGAPQTFIESANKSFKNNSSQIVIKNLQLIHSKDFICNIPCLNNGNCHIRLYEV